MSNPTFSLLNDAPLTTSNDEPTTQTLIVTNTASSGEGSLYEAISKSNLADITNIIFDESLWTVDGVESKYAFFWWDSESTPLLPVYVSNTMVIGNDDPEKKVYIDFAGTNYIGATSNSVDITFKNIVFARPWRTNNSVLYLSGSTEKKFTFINCAVTDIYTESTRSFINGSTATTSLMTVNCYNSIFHFEPTMTTNQTSYYLIRSGCSNFVNCTIYCPDSIDNVPFELVEGANVKNNIILYETPNSSFNNSWNTNNSFCTAEGNTLIAEYYDGDMFYGFSGASSKVVTDCLTDSELTTDFWGYARGQRTAFGAIDGEYVCHTDSITPAFVNELNLAALGDVTISYSGMCIKANKVIPEIFNYEYPNEKVEITSTDEFVVFADADTEEYITAENVQLPNDFEASGSTEWKVESLLLKQKVKISVPGLTTENVVAQLIDESSNATSFIIALEETTATMSDDGHYQLKTYNGTEIKTIDLRVPPVAPAANTKKINLNTTPLYAIIDGEISEYSISNNKVYLDVKASKDITEISRLDPNSDYKHIRIYALENGVNLKNITYKDTAGTEIAVQTLIDAGVVIIVQSGFIQRIFGDMAQVALYALGTPMSVEESIKVYG